MIAVVRVGSPRPATMPRVRSPRVWIVAVVAGAFVPAACGPGGEGAAVPGASSELDSGASSSSSAGGATDGASSGANNGSSAGGGAVDASGSGAGTDGAVGGGRDGGTGGVAAGDAGSGEGPLPGGAMAFPAPGRQGICPDPPLRITFSGAPTLGTSGKIQVFAATGKVAAVVDMAATSYSDVIGGTTFNTVRPVYVDGSDVVVHLKSHALTYGQTYYVNVDPGAIIGPMGTPFSIGDTTSWRFGTAAAAPADLSSLTVALNGSGDFCSVQGAIDALPSGSASAATIAIDAGVYHEIVHFASKNNVTLKGTDRKATIIEGINNNNMNPSTATRSLVGVDGSSGLVIDTMTIQNLTPRGGSQAEALRLQSCDKCVVRNADVVSLQDTLLFSGRIYVDACTIAGNVDFIWGTGTAYFNACEIRTVGSPGFNVQARNSASAYGYVFVDSKLTADPGISGQMLGRIDDGVYPASHVAYINCTMGSHISPAGWTITGVGGTSQLRFWEYGSVDPSGAAINVSQRVAGSTQISASQAMSMRDPTVVLSGWQPP
jgi:pectin methylesterase-like acyl-CoA thioesterase